MESRLHDETQSVVCCGRAYLLLWRVLEHGSATVASERVQTAAESAGLVAAPSP